VKKRIIVLCNPISGAGRALAAGRAVVDCVHAHGHVASIASTQLSPPLEWLDSLLKDVDLLVVAGGDGAVRLAADSAVRSQTPIYHLPFGTENLFAREFGMDRDPQKLCTAIERFKTRQVDVGVANGRIFLLMASVGFDAEVVHDLSSRRGDSISQFSYLRPIAAQLWRWRPPQLEVVVDGQRIDDGGPGFVVVANSMQYGWRLNPGARADMQDGQLDVAYFPASSRLQLVAWAIRCRMQRHIQHPRLAYQTGRNVTISSAAPQHYQLDGDPPDQAREFGSALDVAANQSGDFRLEIGIMPTALKVLLP
jgi:diacylglycerol kinase family enzyme